jgi:hypothetical protein
MPATTSASRWPSSKNRGTVSSSTAVSRRRRAVVLARAAGPGPALLESRSPGRASSLRFGERINPAGDLLRLAAATPADVLGRWASGGFRRLVARGDRRWLSDTEFEDAIAATNLLPEADAAEAGPGPSPVRWTQGLEAARSVGSSSYGFDSPQFH